MNWEIKPIIRLSIKTENGSELAVEMSGDKCYISTRHYAGAYSLVALTKEQVEELKFWLVMN